MTQTTSLISDIKNNKIAPFYLLTGNEPFFIDEVANLLVATVVDDQAKTFDSSVVYANDTSISAVLELAQKYPMMGEKQLVVVKEAQKWSSQISEFNDYFSNPNPRTVLVLCLKNKKIDKRTSVYKTIQNKGILFESKELRDYEIFEWIKQRIVHFELVAEAETMKLIFSLIGNKLSTIDNELKKIANQLAKGETITKEIVEKNTGISKEYNVFELQKTLAHKNISGSVRIVNYLSSNPSQNPIPVILGLLFSYFNKVFLIHIVKPNENPATVLKVPSFFVKDYELAARNYSLKQLTKVIRAIKIADLKSKGVDNPEMDETEILKELILSIVTA